MLVEEYLSVQNNVHSSLHRHFLSNRSKSLSATFETNLGNCHLIQAQKERFKLLALLVWLCSHPSAVQRLK